MSQDEDILEADRNCWRIERASRVAFLVDGQAYFAALADAIESARRSVFLLGWDFHSRVRLRRPADPDADASRPERRSVLVDVLERAVRRHPRLHVHVLAWDFAPLFAMERELLPRLRLGWKTHRRIHFHLDGVHPVAASHHQKVAVIDDRVAFAGGIDVTACRWDSSDHLAKDPRRDDPGVGSYSPFHDVQMLVEGDAARALGDLARDRWLRATQRPPHGRRPSAPRKAEVATPARAWPEGLASDLDDVDVAIARTEPPLGGRPECREVETLYLDAVRAAERHLYIENQYFTSSRIADALAERLAEPDGPEIVIVLPRACSGWLEEKTMGVLRAQLLRRLREADHGGRLAVYHPVVPGDAALNVHAKVLIADARLVRIGSSNLSNRSMGFDTECDLAVESRGSASIEAGVRRLRARLLAEHLGVSTERFERELCARDSLLASVEALRGGERTLDELTVSDESDWVEQWLPEGAPVDPEAVMLPDEVREEWLARGDSEEHPARSRLLRFGVAVAVFASLAALWRLSPLAEYVTPSALSDLAAPLRAGPLGWLAALTIFVGLGVLLVPVTALIVTSSLLFGWVWGTVFALAGALATALAGYGIGRIWGIDRFVRSQSGIRELSDWLARRGVVSVAAVRVIPIAPFTVVNVMAGATAISLRDFVLGTAIGMGPGTLALTVFADRAVAAVRAPDLPGVVVVVVLAAVLVAGSLWLRQVMRRAASRQGPRGGSSGGDD